MQKDYLIASLRVRMDTFGRTLTQAEPYLADTVGEPDITVTGRAEALQKTQPHLSIDDCEYLTTGSSFYRQLIGRGGIMLHSSAVVTGGFAYLFSAPCGTGKSTHTTLWRETFGYDQVQMLNDDKPALRFENGAWYAYGTPWSGKTDQNINMRVPLGGICVLTRGKENSIEPLGGTPAIYALLDQTARPYGGNARAELLGLIGLLLEHVPVWKMRCNISADAAKMSREAMEKEALKRFGK